MMERIASGTHKELLNNCEFYKNLYEKDLQLKSVRIKAKKEVTVFLFLRKIFLNNKDKK
ncbi:MAG: hypothetical protein V8R01_00375 [Bacilli bacterium]